MGRRPLRAAPQACPGRKGSSGAVARWSHPWTYRTPPHASGTESHPTNNTITFTMYMSVCVCLCLSVCAYVCLCVLMSVCTYVCLCVLMSVCTYVCLCVLMSVCAYVCVCLCLSVCAYVCLNNFESESVPIDWKVETRLMSKWGDFGHQWTVGPRIYNTNL